MDGGGPHAGPLRETVPQPDGAAAAAAVSRHRRVGCQKGARQQGSVRRPGRSPSGVWLPAWSGRWRRYVRFLDRIAKRLSGLPRRTGLTATIVLLLASAWYGAAGSGQTGRIVDFFRDVRDGAAVAAGFPIATIAVSGEKHLSREEILAAAGVTARSSLLFFDVADARVRLMTNPWVAEATVQKLLPDRLVIAISERAAFALWQKSGRVGVIAEDGTVLEPAVLPRYAGLPFVVGAGAETRARDFLPLLDRRPELRANVRAAVLVAERRWNLRLWNGVDVRLPEADVERALDLFMALEHDLKLSDRDITSIDLRLPDRVTVRLSDGAYEAREEAARRKQAKPKGGSA
jgi:cell division protein FtsQ